LPRSHEKDGKMKITVILTDNFDSPVVKSHLFSYIGKGNAFISFRQYFSISDHGAYHLNSDKPKEIVSNLIASQVPRSRSTVIVTRTFDRQMVDTILAGANTGNLVILTDNEDWLGIGVSHETIKLKSYLYGKFIIKIHEPSFEKLDTIYIRRRSAYRGINGSALIRFRITSLTLVLLILLMMLINFLF
jgi:hypothetical protein